ncbi:MAG: hypothetical protein ABL962_11420, partial [Fimbriimonadaceae bacterium]
RSDSGKSWVYTPMSSTTFGGTVTVQIWTQVMAKAQKIYGRGKSQNGEVLERGDSYVEATSVKPEEKTTTEPTVTIDPPEEEKPPVTEPETKPIKPEPTKPEPIRDPPKEEGTITVETCADTGLKATIYCPETATRMFTSSSAPRRWCRKHSQDPVNSHRH